MSDQPQSKAPIEPVTPAAAIMLAIRTAGLEVVRVDRRTSALRRIGTIDAATAIVAAMPKGWAITSDEHK